MYTSESRTLSQKTTKVGAVRAGGCAMNEDGGGREEQMIHQVKDSRHNATTARQAGYVRKP
jgi:hypothetical protein